jgi:hypothetical protein
MLLAYKLQRLLEILGDGKWHEIAQIECSIDFTDTEIDEIMGFLGKYDFAKVDEAKRRVKINNDFKKILTQPA